MARVLQANSPVQLANAKHKYNGQAGVVFKPNNDESETVEVKFDLTGEVITVKVADLTELR